MENTLFGSNRTKLTGRTNDFNLDTGLYEAMYEQSQMELKILEAMVKADSLSRKYRASGIYSESAIQAFNEEAKTKIGKAISGIIGTIRKKIIEWWKAFKTWASGIINKIKTKYAEKKAAKAAKKVDAAGNKEMNDVIDRNLNVEVTWPVKKIDWVSAANSMLSFINDVYTVDTVNKMVDNIKNGDGDTNEIYKKVKDKADKYLSIVADVDSFFATKALKDIPEIRNGGLAKLVADKDVQINKMDGIINSCEKRFAQAEKDFDSASNGDEFYRGEASCFLAYNKELIGALQALKAVAAKELAAYREVSVRINTLRFEESTLYVEAAMYEAFMAPSTSDYDLYSAEGIKRFAAAKLEAAMGEISDVIDQAIGSSNAQGIENVNLAGTDVLGAGVSNDPNRLVYDDDCYSQGGTFGDENIAGYVDANIAGTSTSVARGNETKAAMEGFLFNW